MSNELAPLSANSNDLLALAADLGIEMDTTLDQVYNSGPSKYTNYVRPAGIRSLYDAHALKGQLTWTSEGFSGKPDEREAEELFQLKDGVDEPLPIGAIIGLRGIVVNYQQRDELRYYDGEKTQVLCSTIGYTKAGEVIRDLPPVPYGNKHQFDKDANGKWFVNTEKPNKVVEALGLVGFRGERPTSCAECIKCGMSSEVIPGIGDGGSDKKISCEARGKLFFAVFEVETKSRKKAPSSKVKGKVDFTDENDVHAVSDLVNFEGQSIGGFFLLEVPMSKSSIQGKYVKADGGGKDEEASVDGYESYTKNLNYQFKDPRDPLRNPLFHYTKLTYRKNPGKAQTFQADFRSLGGASIERFKEAISGWKEQAPERTVETLQIEAVQSMQTDGTINVVASEVGAPRNITPVEVVNSEESTDLPW